VGKAAQGGGGQADVGYVAAANPQRPQPGGKKAIDGWKLIKIADSASIN